MNGPADFPAPAPETVRSPGQELFVDGEQDRVQSGGCGDALGAVGGSPAPSVSWAEREIQDAVTLEVPKGWVLLDRKARAERSMTDAVEKGLCSIRFS